MSVLPQSTATSSRSTSITRGGSASSTASSSQREGTGHGPVDRSMPYAASAEARVFGLCGQLAGGFYIVEQFMQYVFSPWIV